MLRLLLLLTIPGCLTALLHYPKCCDSDRVLQKNGSTYNCVPDSNKRIQILTNRTNFIESGKNGECVDVEDTVQLFRISNNSDLYKVSDLNVDFYRKCCPLNYFYNRTSHGCVQSQQNLQIAFNENFVKVGLAECKIIEDIGINANWEHVNKSKSFEQGLYCVDQDDKYSQVLRICRNKFEEVCDRIRCIRKCCPDGQSFINGSHCRNTFVHGLDFSAFADRVENINDSFVVVHDGFAPPIYALVPERFYFHLDGNGIFSQNETETAAQQIGEMRYYGVDEKVYCVEHALKKTTSQYLFFRGFPPQKPSQKFFYTAIAMSISCFFLALTILYYSISDEKNTIFGKILISYCSASFFTYLILSYFGLNMIRPEKGANICVVAAFVIFYLTLAVMAWMNVMCTDIFCTFGSSRSFSGRQYKSEGLKRFLLYSLHGWGTPLVLTAFPLIFYHVDVLPTALQVKVTEEKCFLYRGEGNYAQFMFSTVPVAIIQICNLVLFVKTARYCWQVKKEISKMNDNHQMKGEKRQKFNKSRDRFGLLLKLFFIMGISFLFEVVSTFYDFKKNEGTAVIETVWDSFNCLQGLFIFIIFIMKKKILKKFQKKIGIKKLRKISLVSSGMTQSTSLPAINKCNNDS